MGRHRRPAPCRRRARRPVGEPRRRRRTRRRPASATRRPIERRRSGSSSSSHERVADRIDAVSGRAMTIPVSPSTTASAAPPLSPATCGTPQAAASTNTIPNPSCSSPPQRLRHSIVNTSAQPYKTRQVVVRTIDPGTAPVHRDRRRAGADDRASRPPPADREHEIGPRRRQLERPLGSRCRSPCAAPVARSPTISCRRLGDAEVVSGSSRCVRRSSGRKRLVSTPGGTMVIGSGRPAARSASAAGYPPAAMTCRAPRST